MKKTLTKDQEKKLRKLMNRESGFYWVDYLQNNYDSFEEFEEYSDIYNIAQRLGYDDAVEAWHDNPIISGSTNPTDLRKAYPNGRERNYKSYNELWESLFGVLIVEKH